MSKIYDLESDRYKIAALISDCFLFEYHVKLGTLYIFDSGIDLPEDMKKIENFRYSKKILKLIAEEDLNKFYQFCNDLDSDKDYHILEVRLKNETGIIQWYKAEGKTLFNSENKPIKVIGKIYNIDEQKRERQKLKEKSERDPLTTLYNKITTEKQIARCLRGEELEPEGALLLIDFDNFKYLNDNLGHLFGDSVLRDVTAKLKDVFRNTDILGRVGGDEFVAYINGTSSRDLVHKKSEAIKLIFDGLYADKQKNLVTSCSIGVALSPEHGRNYKELFKKADIALYQAKSKGKGCYHVFDESETNQSILNQKDLFYTYETKEENSSFEKNSIDDTSVRIFNLLFSSVKADNTISRVLEMIGEKYNFSRVYMNELSEDGKKIGTTYEWYSQNVLLKDRISDTLEGANFEKWKELYNLEGVLYYSHISEVRFISEKVYQYLEKRNVKSILQCAISDEKKFYGMIGFDDCNGSHPLKKRELLNLVTIGRIIGTYVLQLRTKDHYEQEKLMLREIAKNQNLFTYILKRNSFELMYLNENTLELYPNAKPGDICYEIFQERQIPCENCPLYGLSEEKTNNIVDFYNNIKDMRLKATATKILWGKKEANLVCASEITDFVEIIQGKDDLTGLPSLTKFEKDANRLLVGGEKKYALLSLDIDKFKNINSTLGYQDGNKLLIRFVNTISSKLKVGELFCRSNADKFLVLLEYDLMESVMARINGLLKTVTNSLQSYFSSLRIVIVGGMYITTSNDIEIGLAIDKANIARKSIKGSHSSRIALYDDNIHRRVVQEKSVEAKMVSALNNNEFVVYMQPKIELKSKKIVGAEALVRWQTETGILIPPGDFIPIFEKNGFINQLDFYVYERVFEKMQYWMGIFKKLFPISINISRGHLSDRNFVHKMKELVNKYNIPPNMVELEITESIFLNEKEPLITLVDNLKDIGFILSIDDFGTGYSSLNLLRHLKMDVLKLDKEFFDRKIMSKKESIVLKNVVRMAKELGMIVLSEGVETKEQDSYLTEIGCDLAQGYYFSRPIPMKEFEELVNKEQNQQYM